MRIAIDLQACQSDGSKNRGIGRYTRALVRQIMLQGREHEFLLFLNGNFSETVKELKSFFALPGVTVHTEVVFPPEHLGEIFPEHSWHARVSEQIVAEAIAAKEPDLVLISSLFEGLGDSAATSAITADFGIPTFVVLYDLIPYIFKDRYLGNEDVRAWYEGKLAQVQKAQGLLCISEATRRDAEQLLSLDPASLINISGGVEAPFDRPMAKQKRDPDLLASLGITKPFLLYTGGIDWRKNMEGLISAFAALPGRIREEHQLAIVCSVSDEARKALLTFAEHVGLSQDEVVLTGYVSDAALAQLYGDCQLFVFPSFYEGFGLPALEAMACGAAVIASDLSSLPEIVRYEEALFDPYDASALSEAMAAFLSDEKRRSDLRRKQRDQARAFSWQRSGALALSFLEEKSASLKKERPKARQEVPNRDKPRLAYLSPLPPTRSGIADYSVELLPALCEHYEVTAIHFQRETSLKDAKGDNGFKVRSFDWLVENGCQFDRLLYNFGNSSFHSWMFDALRRFPGAVILHDFYLSGVLNWMQCVEKLEPNFSDALAYSHGAEFLGFSPDQWIDQFPANKQVIDDSLGVLVHSRFAQSLAEKFYGPATAAMFKQVPQLRGVPEASSRSAAREHLGLPEDSLMVLCSGFIAPTKLCDKVVEAAALSPAFRASKENKLIFVGECGDPAYKRKMLATAKERGIADQVVMAGRQPDQNFTRYLQAADFAVQLRAESRGETSRAVLECMSYSLPVLLNANGAMAELPESAVLAIPDEFTQGEIADAFEHLAKNASARQGLAARARAHILQEHSPAHCARKVYEAVEGFYDKHPGIRITQLADRIVALKHPKKTGPHEEDWVNVAESIAKSFPRPERARLLIDSSPLELEGVREAAAWQDFFRSFIGRSTAERRIDFCSVQGRRLQDRAALVGQALSIPVIPYPGRELQTRPGDELLLFPVGHGHSWKKEDLDSLAATGLRIILALPGSLPGIEGMLDLALRLHAGEASAVDALLVDEPSILNRLQGLWMKSSSASRQAPLVVSLSKTPRDGNSLAAFVKGLQPTPNSPPPQDLGSLPLPILQPKRLRPLSRLEGQLFLPPSESSASGWGLPLVQEKPFQFEATAAVLEEGDYELALALRDQGRVSSRSITLRLGDDKGTWFYQVIPWKGSGEMAWQVHSQTLSLEKGRRLSRATLTLRSAGPVEFGGLQIRPLS